ncbi:MAG: SusC/RagA family TonB-linked outer membrane protein [Bacteroidales bacterium]|nr:SusC/RagA family TonB-linked outer membrane protein [Bacteroidales bacterium]
MNSKVSRQRTFSVILLLLILVIAPLRIYAQQGYVLRGTVTENQSNEPVIGANVIEYDENRRIISGSITDFNGNFAINVKNPNAIIMISSIGYKTEELELNGRTVLNIELISESIDLEEIVVVAYASSDPLTNVSQRDLTSSRVKVDMIDSQHLGAVSAEEALQGLISGLDILSNSGNPGSGSQIVIRGLGSLGNAKPLIVVDGITMDIRIDPNFDFGSADQEDIGDLVNIAPQDIKSIEVLKDAASAAVWGTKGADGVLLIETLRGVKGKTQFSYQSKFTLSVQPPPIPMLDGDEYIMLQLEEWHNAHGVFVVPDEIAYDRDYDQFYNYSANTDWVDAITQNGFINDQYFKVSGGGEKTRYFASMNYQENEGTTLNTSLKRISTRINLDYNISDKLRFSTNFSYTNNLKEDNYEFRVDLADDGSTEKVNIREMAYLKAPNMSIWEYDSEGNPTGSYFTPIESYQGMGDIYFNPVAVANLSSNDIQENLVQNSFVLNYNILPWLRFQETISFQYLNEKKFSFLPYSAIGADWLENIVNEAFEANSVDTKINTRSQLFFIPRLKNEHNFSGILMWETDQRSGEYSTLKNNRGPSVSLTDPSVNAVVGAITSGSSELRAIGSLLSLNYKYKDRYIAAFNLRADGSSKFGENQRWAYFPSMSFGWRFSEEDFIKNLKFVSDGKIRISYGQVGKEPKGAYDRHAIFNTANPNQYITNQIIVPQQVQLSELKWQTVSSWNYGIDVSLFRNNVTITADIYSKTTADLLWKNYNIPKSSGFTRLKYFNGGELENQGWEFFTKVNMIKRDGLLWNINFNISQNINTFISFPDNFNNEVATSIGNGVFPRRANIGEPIGSFYGFNYLGVWPSDEDVIATNEDGEILKDPNGNPIPLFYKDDYAFKGGDAIYEDVNHDGKIDINDVVYLGDSNPDVIGGFGSVLAWKNFRINAQTQYRMGFQIVNEVAMNTEAALDKNNQSKAVLYRWRVQGQDEEGITPRAYLDHLANNLGSDRFVEDGDFLRLTNATIAYKLGKKTAKKLGVSNLEFAFTMRRALTFTNYSGQDPEVSQSGDDPFWFGTDKARTPSPKSYLISIAIGF